MARNREQAEEPHQVLGAVVAELHVGEKHPGRVVELVGQIVVTAKARTGFARALADPETDAGSMKTPPCCEGWAYAAINADHYADASLA